MVGGREGRLAHVQGRKEVRKAKVAILEENQAEREMISRLINALPGVQLLSGRNLHASHRTRSGSTPNILFVNVHLARRNGSLLPDPAQRKAAIIALAESPEAALEAFNLRAIDCLLKPVQERALLRAVQRAFDYLELRETKAIAPRSNRRKYSRQVRVKKGDSVLFVPADQIFWIEAQDNYVRIHTGSDVYMERGRISSYEASLDPEQFFRVNRSAIVNVRQIQELRSMFKGAYSVILRNGARVSMSRSIDKLEKLLNTAEPDRGARENEAVAPEFARD
jgi:two-component system LytT family response regulator